MSRSWADCIIASAFILPGVIGLGGSVLKWRWFENNLKVRFVYSLLGRTAGRLFYGIVGAISFSTGLDWMFPHSGFPSIFKL